MIELDRDGFSWKIKLDDGHYGAFCASLRYDEPFDRSDYIAWLEKLLAYAKRIGPENLERWPDDMVG